MATSSQTSPPTSKLQRQPLALREDQQQEQRPSPRTIRGFIFFCEKVLLAHTRMSLVWTTIRYWFEKRNKVERKGMFSSHRGVAMSTDPETVEPCTMMCVSFLAFGIWFFIREKVRCLVSRDGVDTRSDPNPSIAAESISPGNDPNPHQDSSIHSNGVSGNSIHSNGRSGNSHINGSNINGRSRSGNSSHSNGRSGNSHINGSNINGRSRSGSSSHSNESRSSNSNGSSKRITRRSTSSSSHSNIDRRLNRTFNSWVSFQFDTASHAPLDADLKSYVAHVAKTQNRAAAFPATTTVAPASMANDAVVPAPRPEKKEEEKEEEAIPKEAPSELARAPGEEDEEVVRQFRAKLYRFKKEEKTWADLGVGMLRLMKHNKGSRRLVLRNDIGKVLLNTPLYEGMVFTMSTNNVQFVDNLDGKPRTMAIKVAASSISALHLTLLELVPTS